MALVVNRYGRNEKKKEEERRKLKWKEECE